MEQFETKDGKVIQYDNGRAVVIDPVELEKEKTFLEEQIAKEVKVSDKDLLAWAKTKYPLTDYSGVKAELVKITEKLEAINGN